MSTIKNFKDIKVFKQLIVKLSKQNQLLRTARLGIQDELLFWENGIQLVGFPIHDDAQLNSSKTTLFEIVISFLPKSS